MTERQRWRLWAGFVAGTVIVGIIGTVVAVAIRSRTLMVLVVGLMALFVLVVAGLGVRARRQPALLVPPHLQRLDPDQRRAVAATANSGARADDPRLARAVVVHARRQQACLGLLLLSGALSVGVRISHLASHSTDTAAFDFFVIAFWFVAAAALSRYIARARRAIAANRPDVG